MIPFDARFDVYTKAKLYAGVVWNFGETGIVVRLSIRHRSRRQTVKDRPGGSFSFHSLKVFDALTGGGTPAGQRARKKIGAEGRLGGWFELCKKRARKHFDHRFNSFRVGVSTFDRG